MHAVNVPFNDDEGLLSTVNDLGNKNSDVFEILFRQHNDHRILFSRLASIAITFLNHKLSFRIMIICGYFNLILLGHALFLVYKSFNKDALYFSPVAWLIFSPIVYATHLWSLTGFEQSLSIAFSLYSLYFLQPSRQKTWYFSIPFVMAATLANLDGLSVIPLALVWLITQKRKREFWLFLSFLVVYLFLFFANYRSSTVMEFSGPWQAFLEVSSAFVLFTGSAVKILSDSRVYLVTYALGAFILIVYLGFVVSRLFSKTDKKDFIYPFTFVEISFLKLLSCALMIALGRVTDSLANMLAARFQIYSACILALFYLFVLSGLKTSKLKSWAFLCFGLLGLSLNFLSYTKYQNDVTYHVEKLKADSYNFPNHLMFIYQYSNGLDPAADFYKNYAFSNYFKNEKIFRHGNLASREVPSQIIFKSKKTNNSFNYQGSNFPIISFEISNLPAKMPKKNVFLVLFNHEKTEEKPFIVAVKHNYDGWFRSVLNKNEQGSLWAEFPRKMDGNLYDVALCQTNQGDSTAILIAKKLDLDSISEE
ncbi:hypothetical protein ACFP1I_30380 [Dyadobacter subterraneus]|uniref:DUF4153 domain-containing protein n=1 Tax=Dyadobacter subterraneus TaxID=2773304 RepID=A0ABR9W819_9BACT|nr:hypothetical protein [Dyadobacter subterraneus]MBE9461625.1 hypothetical protein [Dyadobacter subterraneus]